MQGLQIDQDVKSEIANALAIGRDVTVHEKSINVNGWSGAGYIILDQETGSGAYKISGGMNGGSLPTTAIGVALFSFVIPLLGALAGGAYVIAGAAANWWRNIRDPVVH